MKAIPDFADDSAWEPICAAIREPVGKFRAYVDFLSDSEYDGLSAERLTTLVPKGSGQTFIVDRIALSFRHPILVVDLYDDPGRTFRVIPSEMWSIEHNLSIANIEFHEFADNVDRDGIFRGFPES